MKLKRIAWTKATVYMFPPGGRRKRTHGDNKKNRMATNMGKSFIYNL